MIKKFTKYTLVAGGSALMDWCVFVALNFISAPPVSAQAIGRISGGVFSFVSNRHWSFKAQEPGTLSRQGRRFALLYVMSFALAIGLFWLLYAKLALGPFASKLVTDCVCFVFNFLVMNFYVYDPRQGFSRYINRKEESSAKS